MSDKPITLCGYKAVSERHGNELLVSKVFHIAEGDISNKEFQWLGDGIYFYPKKDDAEDYLINKGPGAFVVSAETIELKSDEIYDFEDTLGDESCIPKFEESLAALIPLSIGVGDAPTTRPSLSEFRHKFAERTWRDNPELKVCKARFPAKRLLDCPKVDGVDVRYRREEYCVRKNEYIRAESIWRVDK